MTGRELQLGARPSPVKMEDQVLYTTVVFNMCDNVKPKDVVKTEEVVYSEVNPKQKTNSPSTTTLIEEVTQKSTPFRWITACLGLLSVLLLAVVVAMCVINVTQVSKYRDILALYSNESTANMKLRADLAALEREKEELTVQRNQFNSTLQFIIQFRDFPVESYCTSTDGNVYCEPCMKKWIQNGSSCYFFYIDKDWSTWTESQTFCKSIGGELAIIDNLEEQEFINQHTLYYFDEYHGYWIGLHKNNKNWDWVNGATLESAGFWISPPADGCVLSKPSRDAQKSWAATGCEMKNKFVCEMNVVPWPSEMMKKAQQSTSSY